jgi:hypothetical protein
MKIFPPPSSPPLSACNAKIQAKNILIPPQKAPDADRRGRIHLCSNFSDRL